MVSRFWKYMKNIRNIFSALIFYVSLIKNDKQTKKGKEINIFKFTPMFLAQNPKNKK